MRFLFLTRSAIGDRHYSTSLKKSRNKSFYFLTCIFGMSKVLVSLFKRSYETCKKKLFVDNILSLCLRIASKMIKFIWNVKLYVHCKNLNDFKRVFTEMTALNKYPIGYKTFLQLSALMETLLGGPNCSPKTRSHSQKRVRGYSSNCVDYKHLKMKHNTSCWTFDNIRDTVQQAFLWCN